MSSLTLLLSVFGFVYLVSVVAGAALSLHTARSWHSAYWCHRPLSYVAGWHPVCAVALYAYGDPYRASTREDRKALLLFAVIPLVNTAILLYVFIGCPLMAVLSAARDLVGSSRKTA